jgi:hypothetical protein
MAQQQLLTHKPHQHGASRSGAPGPVAAWWRKSKPLEHSHSASSVANTSVEKLATVHSFNPAQTRLLKLILKGWCYFPHFRGAKYCKKQFCRFSLPTGRCVHSTSVSSNKQLQDLLDELLFRLRSSIRNCPQYKSIRVWVVPEAMPEPVLVLPDLIPLPLKPSLEIGQKPEFVPPKQLSVGPAPPILEFNELAPTRALVTVPQIDAPAFSSDDSDEDGGARGGRGLVRGQGDAAARELPPEEEPLPPFMPPRRRFRANAGVFGVPASLPFPELIDREQIELPAHVDRLSSFNPVFLIDVSGTMSGTPLEDLKAAMTLLLDANSVLSSAIEKGVGFNIVAYSWSAEPWMAQPVPFSGEHLEMAHAWVDQWPGKGGSNAIDAFECCFRQTDVSAIFLLSDGLLDKKMKILKLLRSRRSSGSNVPVHVVGCGDHSSNVAFLSRVAEETQGTYTPFQRNANGVKAIQQLLSTVVHHSQGAAQHQLSELRGQCAKARNAITSAQIDAENKRRVRNWEEKNAAIRRKALAENRKRVDAARGRFEEDAEAARVVAKQEYKELCSCIAARNHARRLKWKQQRGLQRVRAEARVHAKLLTQDRRRRAFADRHSKLVAGQQARELAAQADLERRMDAWDTRRLNWDKDQQRKREQYHKHRAQIEEKNRLAKENAEREWEEAFESECEASYVAHEIALTEWKDKADVIQAKNDKILDEEKARYADAVEVIRKKNELALRTAREEYEEEVAAVEYYNASIQPVVHKAERARMLIANIEKFLEMIFHETQDFAGTVDIPTVVDCLRSVFPDDAAKLLVDAFEEHFTAEELRTRSFYPFFHHHWLSAQKSQW